MENKINVPDPRSAPSYSKSNLQSSSSFFSSITHPSVRNRNTDDIFKRIQSNDILCKLPTRLDPNIQFSDDEEEGTDCFKKISVDEEESNAPEAQKTPELPPNISHFQIRSKKDLHYGERRTVDSTPLPSKSCQRFSSACKPQSLRNHGNIRNLLPQSENKAFRSNKVVQEKFSKLNLLSQVELKSSLQQQYNAAANFVQQPTPSNKIVQVNSKVYSVLSLLGSGGSCKVYSVYDPEKKSLAAIKKVNLKDADSSIREGYKKEIEYLKKLQGSLRVIKMYDYEYRCEELYLVLEHGDIDFARYISNEAKLKRLNPLMIKFYWSQMLEAVADIHKYGIIHSDLKPANFLLVEGNLKLIDFGIATSVPDDKTSTYRDTQVGTVNYMSPEAVTQLSTSNTKRVVFKVGVKSDVWSLGCILYNLVYGFTPFQHLNLVQKIHAIINPSFEIVFKPLSDEHLVDVLKLCLKRNPKERASVKDLLQHPYLTEDKASLSETSSTNTQLKSVMEQMQGLTPRRMNYISKMVQELSSTKKN